MPTYRLNIVHYKKIFQPYVLTGWLFIFISVSPAFSFSQQPNFRVYAAEDGLVSNNLETIYQDQDGFMWFGTLVGISIYDGYRFVNHNLENGGLSENAVNSFFEKSKEEMWVLHEGGIDVFRQRIFIRTIPIGGIYKIMRTKDNRILAAGRKGVYEIKDEKKYNLLSSDKNFAEIFEIGDYFIAYEIGWNSTILIDKSFKIVSILNKQGMVLKDKYEKYWFLAQPNLFVIDSSALHKGIINLLPVPSLLQPFYRRGIEYPLTDTDGNYWFSLHNQGVVCIDKNGVSKNFRVANGLRTNFTSFLFEDAEGNIWVAGNGVAKFFNKDLDIVSTTDGLTSQLVSSVVESTVHHSVWLAQLSGISCFYQNKVYNFPYPDNRTCTWTNLHLQGDSLWVGFDGLWLYKIHHDPNPRLKLIKQWAIPNRVNNLFPHADGSMFVSNVFELLHISKSGQLQKIREGPHFFRFLIDKDELWGGSRDNEGISRWKIVQENGSFHLKLIQQFNSADGNNIHSVAKDTIGNYWFGTRNKGIVKFERQKDESFFIRNFQMQQGLVSNRIGKLFINRKGQLYIGTNRGLSVMKSSHDSAYFEDLSRKYGFITEIHDIKEDHTGDIWMATPSGAIKARIDVIRKSLPPKVFINQIMINNHPDKNYKSQAVSAPFFYNENNFNFEFAATTFRNQEQVLYSYELVKDNSSSFWSTPQKIHSVSFASLSPGNYKFRVKALSANNVWSEAPAEYRFIILPPYWETWWFRTLISIFAIIIIVLLFSVRLRQLKAVYAIRTKISRDLHDEIGSTLSGVSLFGEMAKAQLVENKTVEVSQSLDKIIINSGDMLGRMSDIVWAINPQNDSFEMVVTRLKIFAAGISSQKKVQLHFEVAADLLQHNLDMQRRKNIYMICKEAINNVIKYSECNNLYISFQQAHQQVHISINDDGKGFDTEQNSEGNGLRNMQERAQEIKAILSINSIKGRGTEMNLFVKII